MHFDNLGKLLLLMSLLWGYFVFAERLTLWYGNEPSEMAVFWATQRGAYRAALLDDGDLQLRPAGRHPVDPPPAHHHRHASSHPCGVLVGMWLERFLIIVPSLAHKRCPTAGAPIRPQPVEIVIMARRSRR